MMSHYCTRRDLPLSIQIFIRLLRVGIFRLVEILYLRILFPLWEPFLLTGNKPSDENKPCLIDFIQKGRKNALKCYSMGKLNALIKLEELQVVNSVNCKFQKFVV